MTSKLQKKLHLQEAKSTSSQQQNIHVSSLAYEVLEQISFEARKSEFVDEKVVLVQDLALQHSKISSESTAEPLIN